MIRIAKKMTMKMTPASTTAALLSSLSKYHPIIVEGMGNYDPRDPMIVANHIIDQMENHWQKKNKQKQCDNNNTLDLEVKKPKLVITQGDPLSERGISAITPQVAKLLAASSSDQAPAVVDDDEKQEQQQGEGILCPRRPQRGLVCLDEYIAPYHIPNADRNDVILEFRYSQLCNILESNQPGTIEKLEQTIDDLLLQKNNKRKSLGKPPVKDYFRHFALLQEVTKAACLQVCGDITIAHTANTISEFSVTSFYEAGLKLGLISQTDHMVSYDLFDELDFDLIDKR